jgi:ABC-type enterochelin transport system permease subunit
MEDILALIAMGVVALCGHEVGILIWVVATDTAHRARALVGIVIWALIGAAVFVPVLLFVTQRNPGVLPIVCGTLFLLLLASGLFTSSRAPTD